MCGEARIPRLQPDPPAGEVGRGGGGSPAAPFMQKPPSPEWASAPAAAAPGPSGPRPGRLSTQVLLPAGTRRTKCPPGASNKNCAVDLTVHFKGASRAHGPEREVGAGRAPRRPPATPRQALGRPARPAPTSGPDLGAAEPPRVAPRAHARPGAPSPAPRLPKARVGKEGRGLL